MPSDVEMSDCGSSPFNGQIDLDPTIASSVNAGPERVTHNCKDYVRRPAIYAAEAPSVIWRLGEEYERRGKRFWRCGICKKNKLLAIQIAIQMVGLWTNCAATVYPRGQRFRRLPGGR